MEERNNKMCGIYLITNLVNGKKYVGQSNNIEKRFRDHRNNALSDKISEKNNQIIYRAMRKYGFENFSFEILIECEEDLLDLMEIYYIKKYNTYIHWENNNGYNMTTGGQGARGLVLSNKTKNKISKSLTGKNHPMYGKHHSEKTKQKIKENHADFRGEKNPLYGKHHTEESKKKNSEQHIGKKHSDETKQKMRESKKDKYYGENNPRYGKHHTKETIEKIINANIGRKHTTDELHKMSESHKGGNNPKAKKVICDNVIWGCITECAKYYGEKRGTMSSWINGVRKMPQKYIDMNLHFATKEEIENIKNNKERNDR